MSFIVYITAISVTAISSKYLRGWPLPCFGGSCSSALGNDWGLAGKGTGLADLTDPYGSTESYRSSR